MLSPVERQYLEKRYHEIVDGCPICGGRKAFCQCKYAFQFEYAKIRANIPMQFRTFTMDDFTHPQLKKQKQAVLDYAASFSELTGIENMYLCGSKGTGKSAVAAWLLQEALKLKKTGYYFHTLYAAKVAATKMWDKETRNDADCVALKNADFIVIDKIGEGTNLTGATFEELREVLRERAESSKVTIFVGSTQAVNLVSSEKDLLEVCDCCEISFSGFDYKKEVLKKAPKSKKEDLPEISITKKRGGKK